MKKITIILCVLLLTGCSTRFAYNNISWLVYWYIDDYIELNENQEDQFDEMLDSWMIWHKTEELPKYKAQLQEIIQDIKGRSLDEAKFEAHRIRVLEHWQRARTYVASDLVTLGSSLSNDQVVYLLAALEKKNKEDEEEILDNRDDSLEKQNKRWVKRNQKNIKNWLGTLSSEQELLITSYRDRFLPTRLLWIEYRRDYQAALREVFAMASRGEQFETKLHDLIIDPEQYRSAIFNAANENNNAARSDYFIALLNLSSDKQIKMLIEELDGYIDDIEMLQK